MDIKLQTIPHKNQRYETVGDWIVRHGKLREIYVSDMHNEDYALLVAVHELLEAAICLKRGVTQKQVDEFDKAFEAVREDGNTEEPGDQPDAPYYREHQFATKVERMLAQELGVEWDVYDRTVVGLSQ